MGSSSCSIMPAATSRIAQTGPMMKPEFRNNWHDQGAATLYMAANPNKLTLDYTGSIVLNMHQMKLNESLEIMGGLFINKVTGVPQCFIHANGPALFKLNRSLIAYQSLPPGGSMRLHGW